MKDCTSLIHNARQVLLQYRLSQDGNEPRVVTLPSLVFEELNSSLATNLKKSIFQIIPLTSEKNDPQEFEYVIWREVSRFGRLCKRIYVLPYSGFGGDMVNRFLMADKLCNIESRLLTVSKIPSDSSQMACQEMWILDEENVLYAFKDRFSNSRNDSQYIISCRPEDVRSCTIWWDKLWSISEVKNELSPFDLEEPLSSSADLLYGVAPVMCCGDHIDRSDCSWYHGTWQYLRLLQLVSTPTWHDQFYKDSLALAFEGKTQIDVAITGTADYSMLAYVWGQAAKTNLQANIDIVDLCPTPLFACKWFAKRNLVDVRTLQTDVRKLFTAEQDRYDVVCTDAFLTRFARADTLSLLAGFHGILKQGGSFITTVRIHNKTSVARDYEELISDFKERAIQRAYRWEPFLHRSAEEIGNLAELYARKMQSTQLGSEHEIMELLLKVGFNIRNHYLGEVPGELTPTVYLRLFCEKY